MALGLFRSLLGFLILLPPTHAHAGVEVLAIGANRSYASHLTNLKYAERDAKRFSKAMSSVGLVPGMKTTTLYSPTMAEFRKTMKKLRKRFRDQNSPSDTDPTKFVFYFSGHSDEQGLHLKNGAISKAEILAALDGVSAHSKIAIFDSCFSGALASKGIEPAPEFEIPKMVFDEPSGSVFLTASTSEQMAYESKSLKGSIFTHHLLNGLYGSADGNSDGIVTVDELYQYVYHHTRWATLDLPNKQTQQPEFMADLKGQGAIALSFPARAKGDLELAPDLYGNVAIASGTGLQIFKLSKHKGQTKRIRLPIGTYEVVLKQRKRKGKAKINLKSGINRLKLDSFQWDSAKSTLVSNGIKGAPARKTTQTLTAQSPKDKTYQAAILVGAKHSYLDDRATGLVIGGQWMWRLWGVLWAGFEIDAQTFDSKYERTDWTRTPYYDSGNIRENGIEAHGLLGLQFRLGNWKFLPMVGYGEVATFYKADLFEGDYTAPVQRYGMAIGYRGYFLELRQTEMLAKEIGGPNQAGRASLLLRMEI